MDPIIENLSALANGAFRARLQLPPTLLLRTGTANAPQVTLQGQIRSAVGGVGSPAATFTITPPDEEGSYTVALTASVVGSLVVGSPYHYDIVATEPDDGASFVVQFGLFAVAPGVTILGYVPPVGFDVSSTLIILGML